ncbi:hypothetical protein Col01nite_31190 [Cellulomonas oligotrophica]|uniref:Uncharacterized protein n=1 Tax=Cellulomonas oligotrophica TaxID=931536 RepID=A0ABQ4DE14_9CELL|nr:hypothetical protein Col01nite_31190 [Cellulomonas oligotrophica]
MRRPSIVRRRNLDQIFIVRVRLKAYGDNTPQGYSRSGAKRLHSEVRSAGIGRAAWYGVHDEAARCRPRAMRGGGST